MEKESIQKLKCNLDRNRSKLFGSISGKSASLLNFLLKNPFSHISTKIVKWTTGLDTISNLNIDDPPVEFSIVYPSDPYNIEPYEFESFCLKKDTWPYLTIYDYRHAYLTAKTTPLEVSKKILELCEMDVIKSLNAIAEIRKESVLEAAQESTKRFAENASLSVVDGVPFFVKEHIPIKKYTIFVGSEACPIVSEHTAFCVEKLIEKGALLIGTTTMPQLGSNPIGINPSRQFPSPLNPWDISRYAGGSSSGCAIVIAIGLCPFAIGSDSLGSIRVPSAFNGIVGLRPTFSRISYQGSSNSSDISSEKVVGPMACCVSDALLVYEIMSQPDKSLNYTQIEPPHYKPNFDNFSLKNIRFSVFWDYIHKSDDEYVKNFQSFCKILESRGCLIQDVQIPDINEITMSCIISFMADLTKFSGVFQNFRNIIENSNDINLRVVAACGQKITEKEQTNVNKQRSRAIQYMKKLFEDTDILLLLTTCSSPPIIEKNHLDWGVIDQKMLIDTIFYAGISSLTGIPSLCLNIGYEQTSNLPISVQLLSSWWKEDILFSTANEIEKMLPLNKRPGLWQNALSL